MMAMVKMVLLLFLVFKASAREISNEDTSNSTPASLSDQLSLSSKGLCVAGCALTCAGKPGLMKGICMGVCIAKCILSPADNIDEIMCTLDCAQSSTNSLTYDENMVNEIGHVCYQQCKRD